MITVVIADDQAMVRGGLRAMLASERDIEVVGEAADGAEAVDQVRLRKPDVVLMDVRMPHTDGIEATRRLGSGCPTRVLILTTFDLDDYVWEAVRAGAAGFLLKDAPPEALASAVRTVAAGEMLLAPAVTRRLVEHFASAPIGDRARRTILDELTERELHVLKAIARGLSNAEIAQQLLVSEATVKTHVHSVLTKLRLRGRVQAVVLAYESGLVQPGQR